MESFSIPSNPSGVNATSYRIMPSQGRIITLSRAHNDQASKQSIESDSKENTLPNLQTSTVFRFGEPLHRVATLPPAQTPPRTSVAPARTPKPVVLQERPRPTPPPTQPEKREHLPVPGKSLPPAADNVVRHPFKSGKWVPEEDNELRNAISANGTDSWEKIAVAVGTRSAQQCRDRWTLYLADGLNSNDLTPAEIDLMKKLLPAYVRNRKKPWAKLAESFPSRTGTILKNAWKRYENSQKPKRALSQSSLIRAQKREEAERLAAEEGDDMDDDELDVGESLYEYLTSAQASAGASSTREPLKLRLKVKQVEAVLATTSAAPALSSPTKPLALRSLPVSHTTPGKVSLLPDYQTLANLADFSSPMRSGSTTSNFLGGPFFSPPRMGLNAPTGATGGRSNLMFSPPRPINRNGAGNFNLPPVSMTPTPLRGQNLNARSAFSPLPWRGFDTSLYDNFDTTNARNGNVDPSSAHSLFIPYADSSIMLPDMHTANASISEFNDPSTSAWLFTDSQVPGHNPWSV